MFKADPFEHRLMAKEVKTLPNAFKKKLTTNVYNKNVSVLKEDILSYLEQSLLRVPELEF